MVIIKKLIDIWIKLYNNNQKPKGETCKSISWFLDFYHQYEDTHCVYNCYILRTHFCDRGHTPKTHNEVETCRLRPCQIWWGSTPGDHKMGSSSDLNCFPNRGRPQFGQSPRFVGLNSHVCPQYTPLTSAHTHIYIYIYIYKTLPDFIKYFTVNFTVVYCVSIPR